MNYDTTIHNLDTYILNIDLIIVLYYPSIIGLSQTKMYYHLILNLKM
jgi:hypothetical protein